MWSYHQETFTADETSVLRRFFTNTERPVFGLINMPEVVKGALFARYSRSGKSIRRLFLDEFAADPETGIEILADRMGADGDATVGVARAERLYQRIFTEYGDDSVAQLGGAHLACEQASNVLTKALEWGRLAAYLEQSTRYIFYDAKLGDRYRYGIPPEIDQSPLRARFVDLMERLFDTYSELVSDMNDRYAVRFPRAEEDAPGVWRATIRAKACDSVRGLLPGATLSNLGVYGTGQAYEMALVRMQGHPLGEVRDYGQMMLEELRKMIPSFLTRVDREDRGVRWSRYLEECRRSVESMAPDGEPPSVAGPSVTLTDWDTDAERKVAAAALYAVSELPDVRLGEIVEQMSRNQIASVIRAYVGSRTNRRHKPGRAMERTAYRFDVVCDYGAFRDLQRHRMLTIEWQRFSPRLGFDLPPDIVDAGHEARWLETLTETAELYEAIRSELGPDVAQYVVPFAANVRFVMEMSPREAFHVIELRTQPAGHPSYRWVCQEMHRQIADVAGHQLIAEAMSYVDHSTVDLERLESERRAAERRAGV